MTLTLDDVRNKRFQMARKSGYDILEVDEFVDEVEESFAQLLEDNQNLKKQIEALKSAPPAPARTPAPVAQAPTPSATCASAACCGATFGVRPNRGDNWQGSQRGRRPPRGAVH